MRRIIVTLSALLLLIGLLGGGVASADKKHKHRKHDGKQLTLYADETSSTDVPSRGEEEPPQVGDRFLIVDTLYRDRRLRREVGQNLIDCTFVSVSGETEEDFAASLLCHGVLTLDGKGDISWQGQTSFSAEEPEADAPFITVALTGGTGRFTNAGGEAEIFETGEESQTRYEIDLLKFKTSRR